MITMTPRFATFRYIFLNCWNNSKYFSSIKYSFQFLRHETYVRIRIYTLWTHRNKISKALVAGILTLLIVRNYSRVGCFYGVFYKNQLERFKTIYPFEIRWRISILGPFFFLAAMLITNGKYVGNIVAFKRSLLYLVAILFLLNTYILDAIFYRRTIPKVIISLEMITVSLNCSYRYELNTFQSPSFAYIINTYYCYTRSNVYGINTLSRFH